MALTELQRSWLAALVGAGGTAAGGGVEAAGAAAPALPGGGPGGDAAQVPAATDTDLFFAKDSAKLTASDTKALDAYAHAYLAAGSTETVTVQGFASTEGEAAHNGKLAAQRAQAVVAYLVGKGIPKSSVSGTGQGETSQFGADLPANRRATLSPKPPAAQAAPDVSQDAPQAPELRLHLTPQEIEKIIGADTGMPRAQVEKELAAFLEALQKAQGGKSLRVTDKVRMAGNALSEGLGNPNLAIHAMLQDDRFNHVPKELARKVANALPDTIPRANFDKFLALKPKDVPAPENLSLSGAVAKLITPAVKKAVGFLPEAVQKKVLDGIEDAVAKGLVSIAEKAMEGSGLDDGAKEAIKSAVEAAIKQKGGEAGKQ